MRKSLEVVALAMLAVLFWITYTAIAGPQHLPDRVPMHFDIHGTPNGWGSPNALWLMPAIGAALYLIITLVSFFPGTFHYPVVVPEKHIPAAREITLNMVAWIKVELVCLLTWLQSILIRAARTGDGHLPPLFVPVFVGIIFATIGLHLIRILRVAKAGQDMQPNA